MSINISELIWTVICFFVLLVVLKKLLFDPLVSFMAARDARIQDGISAGRTAQQQLDAAAQARSDAQRRQSAAADALLAEAKSASERKRAQTLQAAHQEAAQATRAVRARVRSEETARCRRRGREAARARHGSDRRPARQRHRRAQRRTDPPVGRPHA